MLKTVVYKKDKNYVELTGTIDNLLDHCKYVPQPLITFDLLCYRPLETSASSLLPTPDVHVSDVHVSDVHVSDVHVSDLIDLQDVVDAPDDDRLHREDHLTQTSDTPVADDASSLHRIQPVERQVQYDRIPIVIFGDEKFHERFRNGDRVKIEGEWQSRPYTKENREIDPLIQSAVKNYISLFDRFPANKQPTAKRRETIVWESLLQVGLIPGIPADSILQEEGVLLSDPDFFWYRVDEDGDVHKETELVSYSVNADICEAIQPDFDVSMGDKNKIVLVGCVQGEPTFDFKGGHEVMAYTSFSLRINSRFSFGKKFFLPISLYGKIAEEMFENIKNGDYIRIVGKLRTKTYEKTLTKRWVTPSGNRKKKSKVIELTTYETIGHSLQLCLLDKKSDKK